MYTGWRRNLKYPLNRPLTEAERAEALPRDAAERPAFDERGGLVALNSTYIEWIDRRFRVRGAGSTGLTLIGSLLGLAAIATFLFVGIHYINRTDTFFAALFGVAVGIFIFVFFYWLQWGIDFFQKTYWPIRFNRKNRMIYVYRDKRDGGILRVPWDDVYFHVGHGMMNRGLCDIRGEVLEGDTVKDTFALGPYYPEGHVEAVRQAWAFICRYMEKGPEAVGPDPRDRYVENSLRGTWMDCAGMMYTNYPPNINVLTAILGWPMIGVTTVTRWLVLKSCRMPVWPEDIESTCRVSPDDRHVWPQPEYGNQFVMENPEVKERLQERRKANRRYAYERANRARLHPDQVDWDAVFGLEPKETTEKDNAE